MDKFIHDIVRDTVNDMTAKNRSYRMTMDIDEDFLKQVQDIKTTFVEALESVKTMITRVNHPQAQEQPAQTQAQPIARFARRSGKTDRELSVREKRKRPETYNDVDDSDEDDSDTRSDNTDDSDSYTDEPQKKKQKCHETHMGRWHRRFEELKEFLDQHGRYPRASKSKDHAKHSENKLYTWLRYHKTKFDEYCKTNPELAELTRSLPDEDVRKSPTSCENQEQSTWDSNFEKVRRVVEAHNGWPNPSSPLGGWIRIKVRQYLKTPDGKETKRQLSEWSKIPGWLEYVKNMSDYWKNPDLFNLIDTEQV